MRPAGARRTADQAAGRGARGESRGDHAGGRDDGDEGQRQVDADVHVALQQHLDAHKNSTTTRLCLR